jgi:hypothetical protein
LLRNPMGRAGNGPVLRYSSFIGNNHISAWSVIARKPRRGEAHGYAEQISLLRGCEHIERHRAAASRLSRQGAPGKKWGPLR